MAGAHPRCTLGGGDAVGAKIRRIAGIRHLKLDFYGLRRRVNGGEDSGKESSGGFVEVRCVDVHPSGPVFGRYEMEIEIHKRDEAMVRIRQSGPSGIDVGDIVERVLNS